MSDLSELHERIRQNSREMLQNPAILRSQADDLLLKAWKIYTFLGEEETITMETSQAISALTLLAKAFTEKAESIEWIKSTGQE